MSGADVAGYFFDTSAVVKRYVQETGTRWIRGLTRHGKPDPIYLAHITTVELASAVARRRQGGSLAAPRVSSILSRFRSHVAGRYLVVEVTPVLLEAAARLANPHELRAYDALQLASALQLSARWQSGSLGGITLVLVDQKLNAAATAEGLTVEDPDSHSVNWRRVSPRPSTSD